MATKKQIELIIEAIDKATWPIKKISSSLNKNFSWVKSSIWSLNNKVLSLSSSLWWALVTSAKAWWIAIAWLGWAWLKMAWDFEQTRIGLETMLKSWEKAGELLDDINKFASKTPFEFPEIASTTKSLIALWSEQENIVSELTMIWDIASGLWEPLWELSILYWKARQDQILYTETINQFNDRWIPVWKKFAEKFWVSIVQVKKMASEWKIEFESLQEVFEELTTEWWTFAWGMEKQSQSLNWLLSTAKDWLWNILREVIWINTKWEIASWSILDKSKWLLNGMISFLNQNTENIKTFANNVILVIGQMVSFVTTLFTWFYTDNSATIQIFISEAIEFFRWFFETIKWFWEKYWESIMTVCSFIFTALLNIITWVMDAVLPLVKNALEIIWNAFNFLASLITWDFSWAWESLKNVISWVISFIWNLILWIVQVIWRVFWVDIKEIIDNFVVWFPETLKTWISGIVTWITEKVDEIVWIFKSWFDKIKKIWDDIKNIVWGIASWAKNAVNWVIDSASWAYDSAKDKVNWAVSWVWKWIWNTWDNITGQRALWWVVEWSSPYLVWERWPEIFVPNGSWKIIPNSGVWGAWNLSISVSMWWVTVQNEADENELAEKITEKIRREIQYYKMWIN